MKPTIKNVFLAAGMGALTSVAFVHCGSDTPSNPPQAPASNPGTALTDLGNFNVSCNGQSSGQQKQVPFQQQQQSGCKPQKIQYQQQKAVDYDLNLDCRNKQVVVKNKGKDQQQQSIPIQNDGTVKGKVQYQQQVQNDGKGNQVCWIQYEVNFDGKAQCGSGQTSATPVSLVQASPSPAPSASSSPNPTDNNSEKGKLSLVTTVNFSPSTQDALKQIGIEGTSPSPRPSGSPSPSPAPSPSPTPSASPSVTPTPTGTPVVICTVDDNACPIVGSTDLSCGE